MNRYILGFATLILSLAIFVSSCKDDEDNTGGGTTCDTTNVTYTNSIAAILNSNCASSGCHDANSNNGSLANYADAAAFAGQGRIVGAINHSPGFSPMPYPVGSSKLAACSIDKIEAWISAGTPE